MPGIRMAEDVQLCFHPSVSMAIAPSTFATDLGVHARHLFAFAGGGDPESVLERIAQLKCPVTLVGEAGTGKRSVVRALHALAAPDAELQFLHSRELDPLDLIEALSRPGTLYMEHVFELAPEVQRSLAAQLRSVRCRVVCGTEQSLTEGVTAGRLTEEFLYAVGAVSVHLVPLRYRQAELVGIAEQLLHRAARDLGRPLPAMTQSLIDFVSRYSWPGNLQEMGAAMQACALIGDSELALAAVRASMVQTRRAARTGLSLKEASRAASMQAERSLITETLMATGWNRKRAAKELKISYKALLYKLKQIGMEPAVSPGENGVK
jgi:two-component system, NtrC family, response regulator AtoC